MKHLSFEWQKSLVSQDAITALGTQLQPECERIRAAWGAGYKTDYASLSLSSDADLLRTVKEVIDEKRNFAPRIIVVIGIGGSSLGARAVYEVLSYGKTHNEVHRAPHCLFITTVDSGYTNSVYRRCEDVLANGQDILVTVISKSGTTTETIANAQIFLKLLADHNKSYKDYVVVITNEDSPLCKTARQHEMTCLFVPKLVGGRFSVFSAVGLFPLGMLGIDIEALLAGAHSMKDICSDANIMNNPAALSAAILYAQYQKGYVIHDTFLFSLALHGLGSWYRQLMGESIGKERDRQGKRVNVGITPTVSVGSDDLHSVAQLYLGGPHNRITTFVSVPQKKSIEVPSNTPFDSLVPMIQGKSFATIMSAIEQGTKMAYQKNKRPYMTIDMPERSAHAVGQWLQLKMVEIMYLGFLFSINPFDQPQVELYKKETREILDHE